MSVLYNFSWSLGIFFDPSKLLKDREEKKLEGETKEKAHKEYFKKKEDLRQENELKMHLKTVQEQLNRNSLAFGPFQRQALNDKHLSGFFSYTLDYLPSIFPSSLASIIDEQLHIVTIPIDTTLYEIFPIPHEKQTPEFDRYSDVNFTHCRNSDGIRTKWFGIAKNSSDAIQAYRVVKKLKLLDITHKSSWKWIWSQMLQKHASLLQQIEFNASSTLLYLYQNQLDYLLKQFDIIQCSIGFQCTWEKQHACISQYAKTLKYVNPPFNSKDCFYFQSLPTIIQVQDTSYGPRKGDLNRVKLTPYTEQILIDTIQNYVNVDGYYHGKFPSLYQKNGWYPEEIGLFKPRNTIQLLSTICPSNKLVCLSTCYSLETHECSFESKLIPVSIKDNQKFPKFITLD